MNDFVEYPTSFPDSVSLICDNLTLADIKSLSLVSQEWFDATAGILSDRSVFHPSDPECLKTFQRNFKNFTVSNVTSDDINHFLDNLISLLSRKRKLEEESKSQYKKYQIQSLRFESVDLNSDNIYKLKQLQSVTTLEFIWCTFRVDVDFEVHHPINNFTSLDLRTLKVDVDQLIDFFYIVKIIQDNKDSINCFHFTTSKLQLNDSFIESIELPLLEEFYCKSTVYSWNFSGIQAFFEKHPLLKRCFLDGSFIESYTTNAIKANCPLLEELHLERATSAQLQNVTDMKNLKGLSISGPEISKNSLLNLRDLKLEKLSIHIHKSSRLHMKKVDLETLLGGLKNLTEVDFSNSDNLLRHVKTEILCILSRSCPLLTKLDLSGNRSLEEGRQDFEDMKEFENLRVLNLYNTGLKDQTLNAIICPKLQEGNFGETDIKSEALRSFISRCPFMKIFKFRGSRWISDKDVSYVTSHLNYLRNLELQNCTKLTFKSLEHLVKETFISDVTLSVQSFPIPLEQAANINEGFFTKMNRKDCVLNTILR